MTNTEQKVLISQLQAGCYKCIDTPKIVEMDVKLPYFYS